MTDSRTRSISDDVRSVMEPRVGLRADHDRSSAAFARTLARCVWFDVPPPDPCYLERGIWHPHKTGALQDGRTAAPATQGLRRDAAVGGVRRTVTPTAR